MIGADDSVRFSRALLALFAVGSSACTDAGGPSFLTLGVDVAPERLGGPATPSTTLAELCVRMPVLLGSNVEKKHTSSSGPAVALTATRELATVTFPGASNDDTSRSYSLGELTLGVSETVVLSFGGEIFEAAIETGCENP